MFVTNESLLRGTRLCGRLQGIESEIYVHVASSGVWARCFPQTLV